jgi:hypothetical protein
MRRIDELTGFEGKSYTAGLDLGRWLLWREPPARSSWGGAVLADPRLIGTDSGDTAADLARGNVPSSREATSELHGETVNREAYPSVPRGFERECLDAIRALGTELTQELSLRLLAKEISQTVKSLDATSWSLSPVLRGLMPGLAPTLRSLFSSLRLQLLDSVDKKVLAGMIQVCPRPPPGKFWGDFLTVYERGPGWEMALTRLAAELSDSWRVTNPAVTRALAARARDEDKGRRLVKQGALMVGLLLAVGEGMRSQRMRFGRRWLVGDTGRPISKRPLSLSGYGFERWLKKEAINAAEAHLLDQSYPGAGTDVLNLACPVSDEASLAQDAAVATAVQEEPLAAILAQESATEAALRLNEVLNVATPQQRQILFLVFGGLNLTEAARRLGIAPASARVQWHRLRGAVGHSTM